MKNGEEIRVSILRQRAMPTTVVFSTKQYCNDNYIIIFPNELTEGSEELSSRADVFSVSSKCGRIQTLKFKIRLN